MISNPTVLHAKLFCMKYLLAVVLIFTSFQAFSHESLDAFETDYCTNYPEGTRAEPELWKHCCLIHDMYFWVGGSKDDRDVADLDLKSCIEATGAHKIAKLMYYAVRAGSHSPVKYPKRKWNNGWNDGRKDRALSAQDIEIIEDEIKNGYVFITPNIKDQFLNTLRSRLD